MATTLPNRTSNAQLWALALALAAFGNCVLWETDLGVNWTLCMAFSVAALLLVAQRRYGRVGSPATIACAWVIVLAVGASVTADGGLLALIILASLSLFAIALTTAGRQPLTVLRPRVAFLAPFIALASVVTGVCAAIVGAGRASRAGPISSTVRSAAITLPVVVVLILLLGDADPLFAAMRRGLKDILPIDEPIRILFFTFLLVLVLGSLVALSRGESSGRESPAPVGLSMGLLENRVLMVAVGVVMWTFVASALISLSRNPAAKAGSGVTFAEYARSGFAQLSVAATLVIGTVLATRREWISAERWTRRAGASALAGVSAMLVIAFIRVARYEQAYGYTVSRLEAQGYMLVLGGMLVLLLMEIVKRDASVLLAYRSATVALVVFSAFVFGNTDAWIVRRNVERYIATGTIDIEYLAWLSRDATPTLLDCLGALREPARGRLLRSLVRTRRDDRDDRWYAWNFRASKGAHALRWLDANKVPNLSAPPLRYGYYDVTED